MAQHLHLHVWLACSTLALCAAGCATSTPPARKTTPPPASRAVSAFKSKAPAAREKSDPWMRATIARRCVRTCAYLYRDCGRTPACSKQMGRCARRCLSKKLIQAAEAAGRPVAGNEKATAIGVCMPVGVARFVRELRCASGTMPTFKRVGSVGPRHKPPPRVKIPIGNWSESLPPGEADWHIVDRYELRCEDKRHTLYFDIYHCADGPQPWITPKGFGRPLPTPDKLTRKLHAVGAGYRDPPRRPPPAGAKSPK